MTDTYLTTAQVMQALGVTRSRVETLADNLGIKAKNKKGGARWSYERRYWAANDVEKMRTAELDGTVKTISTQPKVEVVSRSEFETQLAKQAAAYQGTIKGLNQRVDDLEEGIVSMIHYSALPLRKRFFATKRLRSTLKTIGAELDAMATV